MNIKFADNVDIAKEYIKDNSLQDLDIDKIFIDVEEDNEKVMSLIAKYSEEQRFELMNKFFDITSNNIDEKYSFCKEHDLIGAILGIFTFSEDFRTQRLKEDSNA